MSVSVCFVQSPSLRELYSVTCRTGTPGNRQDKDGSRLYIHLINDPFSVISMQNPADNIEYAQFLHNASEIEYRKRDDGSVSFLVPGIRPDSCIPVIEVFLQSTSPY